MERQLSHHQDTLCCIAALPHRYSIHLYSTAFKAQKKGWISNIYLQTTKQNSWSHPVFYTTIYTIINPLTGEIKPNIIYIYIYKYRLLFLFLSLGSDTCVMEKSRTVTSCMCNRVWMRQKKEIWEEGWCHPREHITSGLCVVKKTSTACVPMSLNSLPTYLWAARPWCGTQQWMGSDWDWGWGLGWDCGCRGWGCCCCLRCGCCCCPPPDWPYRWWRS